MRKMTAMAGALVTLGLGLTTASVETLKFANFMAPTHPYVA